MVVKTRKQGNSITITIPSEFNIPSGVITPLGILNSLGIVMVIEFPCFLVFTTI